MFTKEESKILNEVLRTISSRSHSKATLINLLTRGMESNTIVYKEKSSAVKDSLNLLYELNCITPPEPLKLIKLKVRGKQILSTGGFNQEVESSSNNKVTSYMEKEVFVTYSWDSEDHQLKVLAFFNHLRRNGYHTDIDRKVSQEETAADFIKMMHSAMTDYKKVIIVLSTGYKEKADSFKGGVGTEYGLIIKDISDHPNKYILVSFDGISNSILPLNFIGREVIDLSKEGSEERLFRKLQDIPEFEFEPVGQKNANLKPKEIPSFDTHSSPEKPDENSSIIEIIDLKQVFVGGSQFARLYKHIEYNLKPVIRNVSKKAIDNITIEVIIPKDLTNYDANGRTDNNNKHFTLNSDQKLFPQQIAEFECGNIRVTNKFAELAFNNSIKVIVYTESGPVEREFPISELLSAPDMGRYKSDKLTLEDFHDKFYNEY